MMSADWAVLGDTGKGFGGGAWTRTTDLRIMRTTLHSDGL